MGPMLRRARRWFPTLRGSEADLYQSAWESVLRRAGEVDDLEKYLESALYSAGLVELRRRRRRPTVSIDYIAHGGSADRELLASGANGERAAGHHGSASPEDIAELREDAHLTWEILDELTSLQQRIIKLRWGLGLNRRETAPLLGVSERIVKRELERAAPVIAEHVEAVRQGRWCVQRRSLVLAYAFDVLSPQRSAKAKHHLDGCAGCRRMVLEVRERLSGLAAAAPLPGVALDHGSHGVFVRAAEGFDYVSGGVAHLTSNAKQHALGLLTRTPAADPATSQVVAGGGLRGSGGAIAALAACVVAGGGATYCAVNGVPVPVGAITEIVAPDEAGPDDKQQTEVEKPQGESPLLLQQSPESGAPSTQQNRDASDKHSDQNSSQRTEDATAAPPPSPAPIGDSEFASQTKATSSSTPAAAPSGGGGEFGP